MTISESRTLKVRIEKKIKKNIGGLI